MAKKYKPLVGSQQPYTNSLGQRITPGATTVGVGPEAAQYGIVAQPAGVPAKASGSAPVNILSMPVKLRQQFLRNAGYQISVDGILGPQTKTATNAFLKGTPAATWNRAWTEGAPAATPISQGGAAPAAAAAPPTAAARATSSAAAPAVNPLENLMRGFFGTYNSYQPMSQAQQQAAINRQVELALRPQIVANQSARAQAMADARIAQEQAAADARNAAGFQRNLAAGLANVLKGIGPQVQDIYQEAGDSQAAYAKGFTGDLAATAAADAGQVNALLDQIGAPQGQRITPTADAANVAYALGGSIPGEQFAREGAAFSSAASMLPGTAVGRGQQAAADALRQGLDQRQDIRGDLLSEQQRLRGELANVLATRPGLAQQAASQMAEQDTAARAQAMNEALVPFVLADKFDEFPGVNPITGSPTKPTREAQLEAAKVAAKDRPRFDSAASRALGYRADQNGNPMGKRLQILPGFTINDKGQIVKAASKAAAKKGKTLSLSQRQDYVARVSAMVKGLKNGIPADQAPDEEDHPPVNYATAIRELTNAGYFSSQALREIALSALYSVYGRPEQESAADWAAGRS